MKPAGWPRYMREKPLKGGGVAYFWEPPRLFLTQGFTGHAEALGRDYATARARAELLTAHLDAWRTGRNSVIVEEERTSFGTVSWAFARYLKSSSFENRVSEPEALRLYIKRTEQQRTVAARKRRNHIARKAG